MKIKYSKSIKLVYCYTTQHNIFLKTFLGSLKDSFELVPYYQDTQQSGNVVVNSETYMKGLGFKVDCIMDAINKFSDPFIFSDVDIVFLREFSEMFYQLTSQYDISGYQEKIWSTPTLTYINTGFMTIKPSKKVRNFYSCVRERFYAQEKATINDERFLNTESLLKEHNIAIGTIPDMIVGTRKEVEKTNKNTMLYHAAGGKNSVDKISLLERAIEIGKKIHGE